MLDFLGTGSAFHTKLGNNSAFLNKNGQFMLFDCGGTVFCKLEQREILDDITHLHIVITHTHPDHVGSLGDLIFYMYYIRQMRPDIYFPDPQLMAAYLSSIGVGSEMYQMHDEDKHVIEHYNGDKQILQFVPVEHVDSIPTFGIIYQSKDESFYYSGDASTISDEIMMLMQTGAIQMIYQDTCGADYEGNVHMSFQKLCERVPAVYRNRICCMHLDRQIIIEDILRNGFSVAVNTTATPI